MSDKSQSVWTFVFTALKYISTLALGFITGSAHALTL